mmetsp:Transcript_113951/g.302827  ORF Transcript_113951/g.302827 Transcript_113951/m.302827 type:complete len:227 (+) Transcript_113951:1039-1719(+)
MNVFCTRPPALARAESADAKFGKPPLRALASEAENTSSRGVPPLPGLRVVPSEEISSVGNNSSWKNSRRCGSPAQRRTVALPGTPGEASGVGASKTPGCTSSRPRGSSWQKPTLRGASDHLRAVALNGTPGDGSGVVNDSGVGGSARVAAAGRPLSAGAGSPGVKKSERPVHLRTVALGGTPGEGSGVRTDSGASGIVTSRPGAASSRQSGSSGQNATRRGSSADS